MCEFRPASKVGNISPIKEAIFATPEHLLGTTLPRAISDSEASEVDESDQSCELSISDVRMDDDLRLGDLCRRFRGLRRSIGSEPRFWHGFFEVWDVSIASNVGWVDSEWISS